MVIYFGSDHRGFELKNRLLAYLKAKGYDAQDLGDASADPADDYVDFGIKVAEQVSRDPEQARGVLICGSGAGMDMTANKFRRVRATVGISPDHVFDARHDDDVNVLCLASNFISGDDAEKMVDVFLKTPFSGEERHLRRLDKISQLENG